MKTVFLVILDGWGILPGWGGNPVSFYNPGFMSEVWQRHPHLALAAFSVVEGLKGRIGTSEVGYASIGSGRIVIQPLVAISRLIENGDFFRNKALLSACQNLNSRLHLVGLVTDSGVHAHLDHFGAVVKLAALANTKEVYLHAILDGIDVPPHSGYQLLESVEGFFRKAGIGHVVSLVGRDFAMDRSASIDRVKPAFEAMSKGKGKQARSWQEVLVENYKVGLSDNQIPPTVILPPGKSATEIESGDGLILFNARFDRTKLLAQLMAGLAGVNFVSFIDQFIEQPISVAFPSQPLQNSLSQVLARQGIGQARITESIKRFHLQYFFQGSWLPQIKGSQDFIIASDELSDYSRNPAMKAKEITDKALWASEHGFRLVVAAYPNPDILGHTGNIEALTQGVSFVQTQLERIYRYVFDHDGALFITADHGNAEQILPHRFDWYGRRHTKNPVPLIFATRANRIDLYRFAVQIETDILSQVAKVDASIADIAPTILELFGVAKPKEMTGKSLLERLK